MGLGSMREADILYESGDYWMAIANGGWRNHVGAFMTDAEMQAWLESIPDIDPRAEESLPEYAERAD